MTETTISELCGFAEGDNRFNDYIGIRDVHIDDNVDLYLVVPVTEEMLNPYGTIHGAVLFAICDSAAGTYLYSRQRASVTMNSDMSFFRPALLGDVLTARVIERKTGSLVTVLTVEIYNQEEKLVAEGSFHMYRTEVNK